jgi:hypothetical protein
MFNLFDTVKVVDSNKRLVKEGIIVKLTTVGARVYQPKCEPPFTDSAEFAEWFPFQAKEMSMVLVKSKKKKKN